jgi:hypothetical protein
MQEADFKILVERGGAQFVGVADGCVRFRAAADKPILSLYRFAIRSSQDVELALKAERERQSGEMWNL